MEVEMIEESEHGVGRAETGGKTLRGQMTELV